MNRQQRLAAVVGGLLLGLASTIAVAGEVKGPPTNQTNTNYTGAPSHANSNCAYSGLNDMDPIAGQIDSIVQTAADAWKYYGLEHGFPGKDGACRGGTNESRGTTP
jgi:hypothetical protein